MEQLIRIQHELNAPKNQYNKFGGYDYRSCEDILAALKEPMYEHECTLTLTDEVVLIGDRYYVKATASISNSQGQTVSASAYAREPLEKKGMDASQITGAASSYARKYALNGLFAIDDVKDSDTSAPEVKKPKGRTISQVAEAVNDDNPELARALTAINAASSKEALLAIYNQFPQFQANGDFTTCLSARKKVLQ